MRGRTQDSGGRSHQAEMGMAMPTTLTVHCENILNKIRKISGDKSQRSTKVENVPFY